MLSSILDGPDCLLVLDLNGGHVERQGRCPRCFHESFKTFHSAGEALYFALASPLEKVMTAQGSGARAHSDIVSVNMYLTYVLIRAL